MNKHILAVGKISPCGTKLRYEQNGVAASLSAPAHRAWADFIEGYNSAIRGADLDDMRTASEISGWWFASERNGASALPADYPQLLSDDECAAELDELIDGMEDEDFIRRGC